jgi:hypothetical protein
VSANRINAPWEANIGEANSEASGGKCLASDSEKRFDSEAQGHVSF